MNRAKRTYRQQSPGPFPFKLTDLLTLAERESRLEKVIQFHVKQSKKRKRGLETERQPHQVFRHLKLDSLIKG